MHKKIVHIATRATENEEEENPTQYTHARTETYRQTKSTAPKLPRHKEYGVQTPKENR